MHNAFKTNIPGYHSYHSSNTMRDLICFPDSYHWRHIASLLCLRLQSLFAFYHYHECHHLCFFISYCISTYVSENLADKWFCSCIWITVSAPRCLSVFLSVCACACACLCWSVCLSMPGRQPAACQWKVVYPAQTLAVYTTLFITGTVLLNYHLIYGLAWFAYMHPNE